MAEHNIAGETLRRGVAPGRGYELGQLLSQIFHPVFVSIATLFLVGVYAAPSPWLGLGWALLCTGLQVIPNAAFFVFRMRRGAYSDSDVSVRHQRTELYLVGIASMLVSIVVLLLLQAPMAFVKATLAGLLITLVCLLVNVAWKISVHSATMASAATIVTLFSSLLGAFAWGCALAVGWARVRTGNHTLAQVLAGFAVAATCVIGVWQALP